MQTDYAGHAIPIIDPATGDAHRAQIFVAVLGASNYTFAWASLSQKLPDWIDAQVRALHFFGGVPKAIVCDNLKAAVAKPLWFERYSRANTGITCARATRSRASSPPSDIGPCTTRERCRRRRRS
jgi:transposase